MSSPPNSFTVWRRHFFAGLAVVLPVIVSIGIVVFLFGTVTNFTDRTLFFLPREWTHQNGGSGPADWYWSLLALLLSVLLITLVGRLAANYAGQKLIEFAEDLLLRVPLINKIYGAVKQVNEAFSSNSKTAFKQVVLIQFPRDGQYSIGFVTGEQHPQMAQKIREKVVSVYVPTTPNPTAGFLILVPEHTLVKLDMSVADGIKFIISLGAVSPDYTPKPADSASLQPAAPGITGLPATPGTDNPPPRPA